MKLKFDIYKFEGEVFAIKERSGWAYWLIDLQRPDILYEIMNGPDVHIQHVLQKYYMEVRGEIRIVNPSDIVWLCWKKLEIVKRVYL